MDHDSWMRAFEKMEPLVNIQGNHRCRIENINVNIGYMPDITLGLPCSYDNSTYSRMRLSKLQTLKTTLNRSCVLNDKLEEYITITKQAASTPIVRSMGLYSGFCTHWEKSCTNDIASLEVKEKELMLELVQIGCDVRVLISLDILKAFLCGYSKSDIQSRVSDLCSICDELDGYKNFRLAVDSTYFVEPILILV